MTDKDWLQRLMSGPISLGPGTTVILPPKAPPLPHQSVFRNAFVRVELDEKYAHICYYDHEGASHPAHVAVVDRVLLEVVLRGAV